MNEYYVYIMSSPSKTLYIGMTNNLHKRVAQHKAKENDGFTKQYNITRLVYYETANDVHVAIEREKQLKGWKRKKKVALLEASNPEWIDLSEEWFGNDDLFEEDD